MVNKASPFLFPLVLIYGLPAKVTTMTHFLRFSLASSDERNHEISYVHKATETQCESRDRRKKCQENTSGIERNKLKEASKRSQFTMKVRI